MTPELWVRRSPPKSETNETMTGTTEELGVAGGAVLLTRHWPIPDALATVVIVHGAAEHSGRWEHVGEFLSGKGFDTHSYDLRGHGSSSGHPMYVDSFEEFLRDLEVVLEKSRTGDHPEVVYGHSLGGLVATAYAVSARPQPDLYVLSAPALGSTTPRVLRGVAYLLGGLLPKVSAPTAISLDHLSRDSDVGEAYRDDPLVHSRGTLRLGKEVFRVMSDTNARLDQFRAPALVIHGADDQLVPARFSAPLADLPNIERKVFRGLRHEMHNEPEAEEVLSFVTSWLKDQVAAASS